MKLRCQIALLASAGIAGLASPLFAQQAAQQSVQPPAAAGPADIIVTAQRRAENLQDVPLAISVVDDRQLAASNITTIADIQFLTPGVNFNSNFGGGFNVRGVGTQSLLVTAEQSVGLVIDGVIQGLPEVSFAGPSYQSLTDIERIEVLKGPQGTLFGKNSSAGVIQIITKNPRLRERTMDATLSYGTDNEVKASATLNIPLGANAALRVNGIMQRRDGFVENRYNGRDLWGYQRYGVRAKLLFEPNDTLSFLLTGEYRRLKDDANGLWTLRNCGSGFSTFNPCALVAPYGIVAGPNNLATAVEGENYTRQTNKSVSLEATLETGIGTLTSITAFRDLLQPIAVDTDATPTRTYSYNQNISGGKQFSQEVRLNGDSGILTYTLGAFYYRATPFQKGINGGTLSYLPDSSDKILSTTAIGPGAGAGYPVDVRAKVKSWALFGQLEAEVVPGLTLIAGGRYTNDRVKQTIGYFDVGFICQTSYAFGEPCHPATGIPDPTTARTKADKFTYKLTARYDLTSRINVYVSYARGYKGPMISYPKGQPQEAVRPETSESWEAGIKSTLLDGLMTFNADIFKVKYNDFQGQQRIGTPPVYYYTTTNAGGLETKGVEADLSIRPTPRMQIAGSLAYIPTKFTEFAVQCYDQYTNPATPIGQCTYIQPGLPAGAPAQFNAAGYPLIYSPKWTYTLRGDYSIPVGNAMSLALHADWNYRSSTYGVVADKNSINKGYGLLNGQISFGREDGGWTVALFSRNLLDKYYIAGIFRTPFDAGAYGTTPLSTLGYSNIPTIDSGRTIGIKLDVSFGG